MAIFLAVVRRALVLAMLCLLTATLSRATTAPVRAQSPDIHGPFVAPTAFAASFDGDVRRLPQVPAAPRVMRRETDSKNGAWGALRTDEPDPARQKMYGPATMPGLLQNFKGLTKSANGNGWPPDTNGDVGPNHYIQTVNTSVGIFSKTGSLLAPAMTFDELFAGTNTPCDSENGGDPVVLYDQVSGRWIVTDFAWAPTDLATGPYYECIAVSKTGDPVSGGWWFYGFLNHETLFPDYPKLGVWSDGIYMSANLFDSSDNLKGVRVWAFDRSRLINGSALDNTIFFDLATPSSLLPSNFRETSPTAGEPNFFVASTSPNTLELFKFHADFAVPAHSTFTGPTNLTALAWDEPPTTVPELNGNNLDTIDSRLMMQNQYSRTGAGESLWVNHTVGSSGSAAVQWFEIRDPNGTPAIHQQSTFQPDTVNRWLGSLAVDKFGNMAIGYSVSDSTMFPAIRYAGRLAGDPLNTLGQGEATLINGTGAQINSCGGHTCTRWGDYSAMTIDPSDGCTFWYTNEYYESSGGDWQTRIASFQFPACNLPLHSFLPAILR